MDIEEVKLLVSIVVPITTVLLGGFVLHRTAKRFEARQWGNQKLVEERLALYRAIAKPLNQIYCFFLRVGDWKNTSVAEVLQRKRAVDREMFAYFPLLTNGTYEAYLSLAKSMFRTFTGPGEDAKLRVSSGRYRDLLAGWIPQWEKCFCPDERDWSSRQEIHDAYLGFVKAFAVSTGVSPEELWSPATPVPPRTGGPPPGSSGGQETPSDSQKLGFHPSQEQTASKTDWAAKVESIIQFQPPGTAREYAMANARAVQRALAGIGPDADAEEPNAGARMVVNISSEHIDSFIRSSRDGDPKPYKNGYDLGKFAIGEPIPHRALKQRELVDRALPLNGEEPNNVYFCAAELNGCGIRFYGDVTLVLKREPKLANTIILDRNSFDLERSPLREEVAGSDVRRKQVAARLSGEWARDLGHVAVTKILPAFGPRTRLLTTGQISEELLQDEDYIEVLRIGSFGTSALEEARVSASDRAHEASIAERQRIGPAPSLAELQWLEHRRRAEQLLAEQGVRVSTVTTAGRSRA